MNAVLFLTLYVLPMIVTYVARFAAIGAAFDDPTASPDDLGVGVIVMLTICYLIMTVAAYYRGKKIARPYLAVFPFIGGLFDIILFFIPLVPTAMNVTVIILAMMDKTSEK